jgi:hypothetical protein
VVAGNSGYGYPTGKVNLQADGQTISPARYDYNTGAWIPHDIILNYGEKSTLLAPGINPVSQSSSISSLAPGIVGAGTHQLQAIFPGDNSFSSSTSAGSISNTYSYTVTKATSLIADFFPIGTPVTNVPVTLAGQLALNNSCAPFGGTVTATDLTGGAPVILGSGPALPLYCDSYSFPVTFTTAGTANPQCPNNSACMHIVRIDYSGDSNVSPATKTFNLFPVYANAASTTSLSTDVATAMTGSPVTLTATVITPVAQHQPAGQMVTFLDGTTTVGSATLGNPVNFGGGSYGLTAQLVVTTLSGGPHNLVAKYAGDAVLTASDSSSSPVIVSIMDYTVQGAPTTLTIKDGQTGAATLSVFPLGGFSQAVQFSCGTLPAKVSCAFSQSTVTPDGVHPTNVTLTVNTNSQVASRIRDGRLLAFTLAFALAGLLLPFGGRKRFRTALVALGMVAVALCGAGCSTGSSTNQNFAAVGTYTINVTASSGTGTTGKTVSLTVNVIK